MVSLLGYGHNGRVLLTRGSDVTDTMVVYYGSLYIPSVGMFCSQRGNISFPVWEFSLPK